MKKLIISMLLFVSFNVNAAVIFENLDTGSDKANESVTFTATNLGTHAQIDINFDLFIQDSWDGNYTNNGPDYFGFKVDGVEIFSATFQNFEPNTTSESNTVIATSVGGYNAINTWGGIDRYFDDYRNGFTVAHTSSTLTLTFFGSGLQSVLDESWRVEDIDVNSDAGGVPPTVPEPSALALMGLGLLGFVATRRRINK